MTRKEEMLKASVAYNERNGKLRVFGGSNILSDEEYFAFNKNPDFIAGAEWALDKGVKQEKREMLDKACEWLENNLLNYWQQVNTDNSKFIEDFRKAMEE